MVNKEQDSGFKAFEDLTSQELMAFYRILNDLYRRRGVDFRQYRPNCLWRRMSAAMHEARAKDLFEYFIMLKYNPEAYDTLLYKITINVSEFFRNLETFEAIRKRIIPVLIDRKKKIGSHTVRIWSAGCATGEEPYSLAIMLKEMFVGKLIDFTTTVYATDIDDLAREKAVVGRYQYKSLKGLTLKQIEENFIKESPESYMIKPELKSKIKFQHHNMIEDTPFNRIDLILCRNVIIYFSKSLQKRVYKNFHASLIREGFLVAGKVEGLTGIADELFERVDLTERIFIKRNLDNDKK